MNSEVIWSCLNNFWKNYFNLVIPPTNCWRLSLTPSQVTNNKFKSSYCDHFCRWFHIQLLQLEHPGDTKSVIGQGPLMKWLLDQTCWERADSLPVSSKLAKLATRAFVNVKQEAENNAIFPNLIITFFPQVAALFLWFMVHLLDPVFTDIYRALDCL